MVAVRYTVQRNVVATDKNGLAANIAIAYIEHENGFKHTVAIPEALIRFAGEGIIEDTVRKAALSPSR